MPEPIDLIGPWEGPGFVDYHTHLLRVAANVVAGWMKGGVETYHRVLADACCTPMDEGPEAIDLDDLDSALLRALAVAAEKGIVEIWEAGMTDWAYLDALLALRALDLLPLRIRLLAASGLAERGMRPRTGDEEVEIVGVKFYADGWLGPRTCAISRPFGDREEAGVLFQGADRMAARMAPLAEAGWLIATHPIGDVAIEQVLDAYEMVFGSDCAASAPRIEHVIVLRPDLVARMAEMGVTACIQPSFGVSDAEHRAAALTGRWPDAYRWDALLEARVPVICGSDYPIESLSPLDGLRDLVAGPTSPLPVEVAFALMTDERSGTTVLNGDPSTMPLAQLRVVGINRRCAAANPSMSR